MIEKVCFCANAEQWKEVDCNYSLFWDGGVGGEEEYVPLVGPLGYREDVLPIMDIISSISRNSPSLFSEETLRILNSVLGVFPATDNLDKNAPKKLVICYAEEYDRDIKLLSNIIPVYLLGREYKLLFYGEDEMKNFSDNTLFVNCIEERQKRIDNLINYEGRLSGMTLGEMAKVLGAWGVSKGFSPDWHMQIQLISSEVAEVAEELRDVGLGHPRVSEELADIYIRLVSMCSQFGIDIMSEVQKKYDKNCLREYKHGHKNI